MTTLSASAARSEFSETLNLVRYRKERVVLHRRGKEFAAVVPIEDLRLLEELEAAQDAKELKRLIAAHKRSGGKTVPLAEIGKQYGL